MRIQTRSITWNLAWRVCLAQVFTVLMAVMALILTWDDRETVHMDMFVSDAMVAALHGTAGGIVLDEARWQVLNQKANGNLWLVAIDERGNRFSRGRVPDVHRELISRLQGVGYSELGSLTPPYLDAARVIVSNDRGHRLTVMAGGRPKAGLWDGAWTIMRIIGPWFFLPLTIVTLLVMPLVIHRAMRGVRQLATQARGMDIGQPGARLDSQLVTSEVAPLVGAFNNAIDKVQQGYAARDKFLADAAHELRVPIAVVQARLSELPTGAIKAQLSTDVARLANVAEHLLDLQRLDRSVGKLQPVDLTMLAREAGAELAPLVIAAGYAFEVDAPEQPVWIQGDALALGRVVANLVHNAIVHGGRRGTIRLCVDANGVLDVSDQGAGVPENEREAIFEPFHRVRAMSTGSGLGLHLTKEIVQHHGGTVSVGEAPGGGARFTINFQRALLG